MVGVGDAIVHGISEVIGTATMMDIIRVIGQDIIIITSTTILHIIMGTETV